MPGGGEGAAGTEEMLAVTNAPELEPGGGKLGGG